MGLFAAFLPIIGQTVLGMVLARVVGGNVVAAIPWSWLSNPITALPIWYGCYVVGVWLWPGTIPVTWDQIQALVQQVDHHGWLATVSSGGQLLASAFPRMLLGSVVLGALAAVGGYVAIHAGLSAWRRSGTR